MYRPTVVYALAIVAALSLGVSLSFGQPKSGTKAQPFPKGGKKAKAPKATQPAPAKKNDAKSKPAAKPKKKLSPADTKALAEWDGLDNRRKEIGAELKKLEIKFSVASRAGKLKIKDEFETLLKEWKTKVEPSMQKLAFQVLEIRPDDEMALGLAVESNRNVELVALTEKLIGSGHDGIDIYRAAYRGNFSLNRFTRAKELLEAARKKSELPFLELKPLEDTKKHIELWKKELELRAAEAKAPPEKQLPRVRFETNRGPIEVVLLENEAPNTVANFISLIENEKLYDGVRIHEAGLDALTGNPATKENFDPEKRYFYDGPDYTIKCECFEKNARMRFRGSLVMHHPGLRDAGASQFAFARSAIPRINTLPPGEHSRTVFGYVVGGMDVVDALQKGDTIKKVTVLSKRKHPYKPRTSKDKDEPEGEGKTDPAPPKKTSGDPKKPAPVKTKADPGQSKPGKTKPPVKTAKP